MFKQHVFKITMPLGETMCFAGDMRRKHHVEKMQLTIKTYTGVLKLSVQENELPAPIQTNELPVQKS